MGHAPWTLWILSATFAMGIAPVPLYVESTIVATAVIPIVWTSIIAAAFCRVVLGDSRNAAIARTALHQTLTWAIAFAYIGYAVALGPRVAAFLGR